MSTAGRVAVVTGGGAGIGRASSERLAADGFKVAILDVADGAAEQAAKSIENAGGVARGYQADVSDREQVDAALAAARSGLGPLAVVVANAAVASLQPFLSMTLDQWQHNQ